MAVLANKINISIAKINFKIKEMLDSRMEGAGNYCGNKNLCEHGRSPKFKKMRWFNWNAVVAVRKK